MSESELAAIANTAPSLHTLGDARVARISRNLVIKKSMLILPSEAEGMKLVSQRTSIHLPRVYRSFTVYGTGGIYDSTGYIVMDYIDGICLSKCWEKLLPNEREDVIRQVVDMIRELQSLHIPLVGPIGGGPSHGRWFQYTAPDRLLLFRILKSIVMEDLRWQKRPETRRSVHLLSRFRVLL